MANQNEFAGVVPQVVHPKNDGETTISEYIEKIEGEVALDSYVKAQTINGSAVLSRVIGTMYGVPRPFTIVLA
jgi:hypothetical protein